jgi:hypothetical protein
MKTQYLPLNTRLISMAAIAAILIISKVYAGQIDLKYFHNTAFELLEDTATVNEPSEGNNNLRLNNINIHVLRDFLDRFKDINNEKWYVVEGGFVAKFNNGNIATLVTYKKNGEWLYTINSYNEKLLPEEVVIPVKEAYNGYKILHIKEINVPKQDSAIFLVYIQNATTIKILRVCDGEMEILHDYIRG